MQGRRYWPITVKLTGAQKTLKGSTASGHIPTKTPSIYFPNLTGGTPTGALYGFGLFYSHDDFPSGPNHYPESRKTITMDMNQNPPKEFEAWMYNVSQTSDIWYGANQTGAETRLSAAMKKAYRANLSTTNVKMLANIIADNAGVIRIAEGTLNIGDVFQVTSTLDSQNEFEDGRYVGPPFFSTTNHFRTNAEDKWLTATINSLIAQGIVPSTSNPYASEIDLTNQQLGGYEVTFPGEIIVVQRFSLDFQDFMRYKPGANLKWQGAIPRYFSHDRTDGEARIRKSGNWNTSIYNVFNDGTVTSDSQGIIRVSGAWKQMELIGRK
jgi:hypothetical protein